MSIYSILKWEIFSFLFNLISLFSRTTRSTYSKTTLKPFTPNRRHCPGFSRLDCLPSRRTLSTKVPFVLCKSSTHISGSFSRSLLLSPMPLSILLLLLLLRLLQQLVVEVSVTGALCLANIRAWRRDNTLAGFSVFLNKLHFVSTRFTSSWLGRSC